MQQGKKQRGQRPSGPAGAEKRGRFGWVFGLEKGGVETNLLIGCMQAK